MENNEAIMEAFLFETGQQLEQLEQAVIQADGAGGYSQDSINDIFRYMHTIKGSSAMMSFNNIAKTAHAAEDLFFFLREKQPAHVDCSSLSDLVLEVIDFIKLELEKIKNGDQPDHDESALIDKLKNYLGKLQQGNATGGNEQADSADSGKTLSHEEMKRPPAKAGHAFKAVIQFQEDCRMENVRAYVLVHNLQPLSAGLRYYPENILDDDRSAEAIKKNGFTIFVRTDRPHKEIQDFFTGAPYVKSFTVTALKETEIESAFDQKQRCPQNSNQNDHSHHGPPQAGHHEPSSMISVNIHKLDSLLDLVGELVIAETMVTQNPDLKGLTLNKFNKAARQLHKITGEIQDVVLSVRMLPIGPTFFKMNRLVRDMKRKLKKEVNFTIIGEDTEMDKSIIERLADPLMHLVRNAMDHGLEPPDEREAKGKNREGSLTLEAQNTGNEVLVTISDDGRGLDREAILEKAKEHQLLRKDPAEMTDKEVYSLILLPGFSTNKQVTEYSGRGVGMDVVLNNIEAMGGSIQIDSHPGQGTTITLKIPLTLAIVDGMNFKAGTATFTLPTKSIKECFKPQKKDIFSDPNGRQMMMIRNTCYTLINLYQLYNISTRNTSPEQGIVIVLETDKKNVCLFVDELLGEQQVVVKAMPHYIKKIKGLAGCTLLGDGGISLILDVDSLIA